MLRLGASMTRTSARVAIRIETKEQLADLELRLLINFCKQAQNCPAALQQLCRSAWYGIREPPHAADSSRHHVVQWYWLWGSTVSGWKAVD